MNTIHFTHGHLRLQSEGHFDSIYNPGPDRLIGPEDHWQGHAHKAIDSARFQPGPDEHDHSTSIDLYRRHSDMMHTCDVKLPVDIMMQVAPRTVISTPSMTGISMYNDFTWGKGSRNIPLTRPPRPRCLSMTQHHLGRQRIDR